MDNQLAKEKEVDESQQRGKESLRLWLRLLRCTNLVERDIQTRMRNTEVTLPRFDFLAILYQADCALNMGDISHRLMVSNGNVSGLAERLVKQGLIDRWQWPDDRRHWYAALTEKGRRLFEEVAREHEQWVTTMLQGLDDGEIEQLSALLTRLRRSINSQHDRGSEDADA